MRIARETFQRVINHGAPFIEREVVPLAQDQGLAILPWSPLAGGLLSGKYRRHGAEAAEGLLLFQTAVEYLRSQQVVNV